MPTTAKQLFDLAKEIENTKGDILFGGLQDSKAGLADAVDDAPPIAQQHFLIGVSLLDQASRHMKLAALECVREEKN